MRQDLTGENLRKWKERANKSDKEMVWGKKRIREKYILKNNNKE